MGEGGAGAHLRSTSERCSSKNSVVTSASARGSGGGMVGLHVPRGAARRRGGAAARRLAKVVLPWLFCFLRLAVAGDLLEQARAARVHLCEGAEVVDIAVHRDPQVLGRAVPRQLRRADGAAHAWLC